MEKGNHTIKRPHIAFFFRHIFAILFIGIFIYNGSLYKTDAAVAGPNIIFYASKNSLPVGGGQTTLTWSVQGATNCTTRSRLFNDYNDYINPPTTLPASQGGWNLSYWNGTVSNTGGTTVITMTKTSSFTLECWNGGGTHINRTIYVTVAPDPPRDSSTGTYFYFGAYQDIPASISTRTSFPQGGGAITFSWNVFNAVSCTASNYYPQGGTSSSGWAGPVSPFGGTFTENVSQSINYELRCVDGEGGWHAKGINVTAPPSLTFSSDVSGLPTGGGTVLLTWATADASSCKTGDNWGQLSGQTNQVVSANGSTFQAVTETKTFTMECFNTGNVSSGQKSVTVTVAPDTEAPSVPTNYKAVRMSTNQINLYWDFSTDNTKVRGYKIFRNGSPIKIVDWDVNSYTDNGVSAGTYTYTIQAFDFAANYSAVSLPATNLTFESTSPSVPTNFRITASTNNISLAWNASTDASGIGGYKIYRGGTFLGNSTGPTVTVYYDNTIVPGTSYTYTVRAFDVFNNLSAESASVTGRVDNTPPSQPGNFKIASITGSSITLTWDAATDNSGVEPTYGIYRTCVTGGPCPDLVTSPFLRDVRTYTLSDVYNSQTKFKYMIIAYDEGGNASQPLFPTDIANAPDVTAPSKPINLSAAAASQSQINVSWSASTDAVGVIGYKVYRNGSPIASNVSGTTYNDTGLIAGTQYTYTISAFDAAGNDSGQSSGTSVSTLPGTSTGTGGSSTGSGNEPTNVFGYAYSPGIGWVSFNCNNEGNNTCSNNPYGVSITPKDEGEGKKGYLSGYAYSPTVGWISFNYDDVRTCPKSSGETEKDCAPKVDPTTGKLTGWARALSALNISTATGGGGGGSGGGGSGSGGNEPVVIPPGATLAAVIATPPTGDVFISLPSGDGTFSGQAVALTAGGDTTITDTQWTMGACGDSGLEIRERIGGTLGTIQPTFGKTTIKVGPQVTSLYSGGIQQTGLTVGGGEGSVVYTIYFRVKDKGGVWSGCDSKRIIVWQPNTCDAYGECGFWPAARNLPYTFQIATRSYMYGGFAWASCDISTIQNLGCPKYMDLWEFNSQNNEFTQKKNLPFIPRWSTGTDFAIGEKGYVGPGFIGYVRPLLEGEYNANGTQSFLATGGIGAQMGPLYYYDYDFWEYTSNNDSWKKLASFPGTYGGRPSVPLFSFVINGKAYTIGTTGTLTDKFLNWTPFPGKNCSPGDPTLPTGYSCEPGSPAKYYYTFQTDHLNFGIRAGDKYEFGFPGFTTSQVWEFDPSVGTDGKWTRLKDFPYSFGGVGSGPSTFSINGKGYFGLGKDFTGFYRPDFYEYDPAGDSWREVASLPLYVYEPSTPTILKLAKNYQSGTPCPTMTGATWGRAGAYSTVIGGKAYVGLGTTGGAIPIWKLLTSGLCGQDGNYNQKLNSFWEFDPAAGSLGTWKETENFIGASDAIGRGGGAIFSSSDKLYFGFGGNGIARPDAQFWELTLPDTLDTNGAWNKIH